MTEIKKILPEDFNWQNPCSLNDLNYIERFFKVKLPDDYKELMLFSNGCEGKVGSAYFLFWKAEKLIERNKSLQIEKYMSPVFIAVASNGGDECYGFDYSYDKNSPVFSIVTMGDLSDESKFKISSSLIESLKKAKRHEFSDSRYNENTETIISEEINNIKIGNTRMKAEIFWENKDYKNYISTISIIRKYWTELEEKKFIFAKKLYSKKSLF